MVRLLDDPWRVLPRYVLSRTREEAHEYLTQRLETATLLAACQRHFPRAFRTRVPDDQEQLLPAAGRPYSQGERVCLELLEGLFPFALEYVEMCADEGERSVNIPLHSFGIDIWNLSYDHDRENWAGWLMLALLNQNVSLAQCQQMREVTLAPCVMEALECSLLYIKGSWSYQVLERVCSTFPAPLCHLATAIRMLDHSTNNLFLDPGEEESVDDATWCEEDIELLAREWKEARSMLDEAQLLVGWLTAHPREFRKVVDLWNLALWTMCMGEPSNRHSASNGAVSGSESSVMAVQTPS